MNQAIREARARVREAIAAGDAMSFDEKRVRLTALLDAEEADLRVDEEEFGMHRGADALERATSAEHRATEAERKWHLASEELKAELATTQSLRAKLTTVATRIDNVWMWQGDGANYAGTLSCPVIMDGETAHALEQRAIVAESLLEAAREFRFWGNGQWHVAALVNGKWQSFTVGGRSCATHDSRDAAIAKARSLAGVE
jgi:hypothetical protein